MTVPKVVCEHWVFLERLWPDDWAYDNREREDNEGSVWARVLLGSLALTERGTEIS